MENKDLTHIDFLEKLLRNRMNKLNFTGISKYEDRLKEEFDLIISAGLEEYFLLIRDILNWCSKNNILTGLARGSAAGSFVMFLLDIVKINPFDYGLLFSRFLNAGRVAKVFEQIIFEDNTFTEFQLRTEVPKGGNKILAKYRKGDYLEGKKIKEKKIEYRGHISLPDVDMDVQDREKVKQFIIKKYGNEQFSLLGSYNTFKIKAAIKDLNRVVGSNLDYAALNILTNTMFFKEGLDANFEEVFKTALDNSMFYDFVQRNPKIINYMYWILDTPKSASVHPCGTLSIPKEESVFTNFPLVEQGGELMCEWTGAELDSLGFVKNDLLGLSQLDFFANIISLIKENRGEKIDIYNIKLDDKDTYNYLTNGWNSEVFQFNSHLLVNYCKVLKPENIMDLAVAVAAVRPGPINSGLHLKYVKRKDEKEEIDYHFGYENFTKETKGILFFQEQLINIASYLGDLTLVEADSLRKALGKKIMSQLLSFHDKIKPNALEKGCSSKEFEEIWAEWIEFAKYSFNKSHAVAYAITGYISQYLKVHYPQEFWTAAFQKANNSSERKEKFNQYFQEIKDSKSNIQVFPPEINVASNKTTFKENNIFIPLNNIKYLSDDGVNEIIEDRNKNGEYYSFEEFLVRLGTEKKLNKRELENLVLSGVFDKLESLQNKKDRILLIQKLYKFLRKDYRREFIKDRFQEEEEWWGLKESELIGLDSIDFKRICLKHFTRFRYFTSYSAKTLENQKVSFGGIILDFSERKTKKGNLFGIIELVCNNIPYTLTIFENWDKLKEKFLKYQKQIVILEGEFKNNPLTNKLQLILLKDCEPIFIGSDESTKITEFKSISFKKFDYVQLENGKIGQIVKNMSNTEIHIKMEDSGDIEIYTKWDINKIIIKE